MSRNEELYLINERTGSRFRIDGCRPAPESDLPKFGSARFSSGNQRKLPPSVDLRKFLTPVEDQGKLNSCVGNSVAGALEFLIKKDSGKEIDVSRLFLYYNARLLDGMTEWNMKDDGVSIPSGIKAVCEYGSCREDIYPYYQSSVNRKPPKPCYDEGKKFRLIQGETMDVDLHQMKCCLADGYPFVFGLFLFPSFTDAETNGGWIPMPHLKNRSDSQGGHAMLAVGYLDHYKVFIIRNSYGEYWGDRGYGYLPYDYMTNRELCMNPHAIKSISKDSTLMDSPSIPSFDYPSHIHPSINYDLNIDYASIWSNVTPDSSNSVDATTFWYDESYLSNLSVNSDGYSVYDGGEYYDDSNEWIFFGSYSPQADQSKEKEKEKKGLIQKISKDQRHSEIFRIIWIDRKTSENVELAKLFESKDHVQVEFCEKYSDGEKFLCEHENLLRSSNRCLIICRGYFPDEKKNAFDLIEFLDRNRLRNVPLIVFTQDQKGLMEHLEKQAVTSKIHQWKSRLEVTNERDDFISRLKFFIEN